MISLEHITMTEFSRHLKKTKTVVFPFGTIEEHGRHLPLCTDTLIITEVLKRVSAVRRFFLGPAIPYGVCTTTKDHPGTISISSATLRSLVNDLISEAYKKGLRNFVLVSGHGGGLHMSAMKEAAEELVGLLEGVRMAVFTPYDLLWKELGEIAETPNDSHAGEIETSMVLYLAPELVKGRSPEEFPGIPKGFVVADKTRRWPGGVWGNPGKASLEKGERAVDLMCRKVIDILDEMSRMRG